LLVETLITRRMTRQGQIYMFRKPQGPPVTDDRHLDQWLHKATQSFDFSPIFSGDQQQARIVAQDYLQHLKKEASRERLEWGPLARRLKQVSPHLRRGFSTFFAFYDGSLRSSQ